MSQEHVRDERPRLTGLLAAMLLATFVGAIILIAIPRPPLGDFLRVLVVYTLYGSVCAAAITYCLGMPLLRYLNGLRVPSLAQCLAFAISGCALAIPFAVIGQIIDGSPVAGVFGVIIGAWCGGIGRALYGFTRRSRVLALSSIAVVLCLSAIGIPLAIGSWI